MISINILLLEDESSQIEDFKRAKEKLERENSDYNFNFSEHNKISDNLYIDLLKNNYDFAIIDLRLKNTNWEGTEEFDGNKFIEHIYEKLNIPIIINTSNAENLDGKFFTENENPLFLLVDHSEYNSENESIQLSILKYILELYKTGVTRVIGKDGKINQILNKLIWKGGLDNIKEWIKFNNIEKAEKSLGRYILSHIHHELSGDYGDFHTEEVYLKNMGNDKYDTGTILKKDGEHYIILTPACDIAQNKFEKFKLYKINYYPTSNNQLKKCKRDSKFILEKSKLFENGGCIDFEESISVQKENINNYNIICYLSQSFLKDLVFQLGKYYSRQGSPDLFDFIRQGQPNLDNGIIISNLIKG